MNRKLRVSLSITLALLFSICMAVGCTAADTANDPFQSYFSEKPFVEFLTEEDTDTLRAQYPQEFELLDEMFGPVTLFREDALDLVTEQAMEDSGSGFAQIPEAPMPWPLNGPRRTSMQHRKRTPGTACWACCAAIRIRLRSATGKPRPWFLLRR